MPSLTIPRPSWLEMPFIVAAAEAAGFLLAAHCAGCDTGGELLCTACRVALQPRLQTLTTPGGLPIRAALAFDAVAARAIRHLKENGETLLARPLGESLAGVLGESVMDGATIVPIPTSIAAFRRRGYRVPELLIRRAGFTPRRLLIPKRATLDQRGLSRAQRAANVQDSMRARGTGAGVTVVLVDDVVTTGATMDEAARVLRARGYVVRAGVALAATPRHGGGIGSTSATLSK